MSVAYLSASPPMSYSVQGFFAQPASRDPFYSSLVFNAKAFDKMGTERLFITNGKKYSSILRQHSCAEAGGAKVPIECQEVTVENSELGLQIPTDANKQHKKKVSFADSFGLSLTRVRVMTEPSDVPPKLGLQAFADILKSRETGRQPSSPSKNFVFRFEQPGGDYLKLRKRLEEELVSLENAVVEPGKSEGSHRILGTVKVRNVSYEKSVYLRFTHDDWQTFEDLPASYVSPNSGSTLAGYNERYDTFSFVHEIPEDLREQLQFCVRFESGGQTYWDNNGGQNYVIVQSISKGKMMDMESEYEQLGNDIKHLRINHSYSWTNFSYWRAGLEDERPYW